MNKINMISKCFSHGNSSCHNCTPELFEWDYETKNSKVSVYVDSDLSIAVNESCDKIKFLWLLESPEFNGGAIEIVKNNIKLIEDTFEAVFTYSDEISSLSNKFHKVFTTNSWIKKPKIYDKSRLISMITSNKVWTEQQKYRVDFAEKNKDIIDVYGRGFKEIEEKEEGLISAEFLKQKSPSASAGRALLFGQTAGQSWRRISRGFEPFAGPTYPRSSKTSIIRAARL